jgi:hypothetical protein
MLETFETTNQNQNYQPKVRIVATRRILQARPNIIKMAGTPNQPIKSKIFPTKKYPWYLKSEKKTKIRMSATRGN